MKNFGLAVWALVCCGLSLFLWFFFVQWVAGCGALADSESFEPYNHCPAELEELEPACSCYGDAICGLFDRCGGGGGECRDSFASGCMDAEPAPASVELCRREIPELTCDELFADTVPQSCVDAGLGW